MLSIQTNSLVNAMHNILLRRVCLSLMHVSPCTLLNCVVGDDGDDSDADGKGHVNPNRKNTAPTTSGIQQLHFSRVSATDSCQFSICGLLLYVAALFGDDAIVSFGSDEEDGRPPPEALFRANESGRRRTNDESSDDSGSNMFG